MSSELTLREFNKLLDEINGPNPKTIEEMKEEMEKYMSRIKKLAKLTKESE